ncbi:hypothetical protein H0A66_03675 [Alcaligenaceae bacterium]|nr:hypothetical protein [Alcaligenaceae bacterium]
MKIAIILLSILAAGGTWWWNMHHLRPAFEPTLAQRLKNMAKSLAAGVVVYFGLMSIALLYLMITTA